MYTQCPECSTAFRVTADVLKQAAGKVRCGGCGNAFNALAYLTETMPESRPPKEAEEELPELRPEPLEDDGLPKSISAEQSAALLKTLDQLAGSNIRIEDTGVEWRVLDQDEVGEAAGDAIAVDVDIEDQPEIDEILEDSPTPVDQFLTSTPPQVDAPEIFAEEANEPAQTPVEELRFDDNTPLPEDFDFDVGPSYTTQPEPEPEPHVIAEADPQSSLDLTEPDEWTEILDEFEELAEAVSEPIDEEELEALTDDDGPESSLEPETEPEFEPDLFASVPEPGEEVDLDAQLEETQRGDLDLDNLLEEDMVEDDTVGDQELEEFDEDVEIEFDDDTEAEPGESTEDAYALEADEAEDAGDEDAEEFTEEHFVPPMSEEEQTINMQIDQDLLAIAVEDEKGFASTIEIADEQVVEDIREEATAAEGGEDDGNTQALKDTSAGFETIIMEGEYIRSALEQDRREADREAALASLGAAAAAREAKKVAKGGKRSWGMFASSIILVLLLAAQGVHQARNTLATIPAFNNVVGPMYRALGKPLSPDWDITGWRFEVTRGDTDEANEKLTVYSRIGNKSDKPLPYPLIGISLTDRFEETIGSRVLDPSDYLADDLDPRKLVEPGNTFNAVITISSPSADATGFKLNVCYRESGGDLRCAIEDFR
jgi:predicted Zn finger-like uncharacterized protein